MKKTYVAIPSCRDWKPQFGKSLCGLINSTSDIFLNVLQGTSVLPRARQLAIQDAINGGFSHILMLDDDMAFPADLLVKMLEHEKDIVGINYCRKNPAGATPMACGLDGVVITSKDKSGLEEVGWIGFGAVLINLQIMKDIPLPWFEVRWMEEKQDFLGEDFYFCMKLRGMGAKIYIDHDISNKCAHIGDFPFKER